MVRVELGFKPSWLPPKSSHGSHGLDHCSQIFAFPLKRAIHPHAGHGFMVGTSPSLTLGLANGLLADVMCAEALNVLRGLASCAPLTHQDKNTHRAAAGPRNRLNPTQCPQPGQASLEPGAQPWQSFYRLVSKRSKCILL